MIRKLVAQEEYARMMQDAIRRKAVSGALANHFGERLERMATPQPRRSLTASKCNRLRAVIPTNPLPP